MLQLNKKTEKVCDGMEYFSIQELDLPNNIWDPFAQHYAAVHYKANRIIYFQESTADCFYYLKKGKVKTYISSEDGTEKLLTVYKEGNLFGEAAFFDEMPRVSSAITISPCEIIQIDRQRATYEVAQNPELALALMKYLARTVRLLSRHIDDMAFLKADKRVIRFLLSLPRDSNGAVKCTQDEIASSVSANRVTVCRILNRLSKDGCITTGYRTIKIPEAQKLYALL